MSNRLLPCALALGLVGATALAWLPARPLEAQTRNRRAGFGVVAPRYIVVLKEDAGEVAAAAADLARAHGLTVGRLYRRVLRGFVARLPASRVAALRRDPRVAYVEPDQRYRSFATFPIPSGIDRIDADLSPTARIDGVEDAVEVDIAIVDTGIQRDHPDLNVVGGRNFVMTDEGNDRYDDLNGHGTHVAGTVAARDNGPNVDGVHVVGVVPGARLWAVRVIDADNSSWTSWVIAGVDWLTDTGAHPPFEVANLSLGGGKSQALNDAVTQATLAGITVVVAAGNDDVDCAQISPACSTAFGVITVSELADANGMPGGAAAFDGVRALDDRIASFSNFGTGEDGIDIMAPGVAILSTYPGGRYRRLSGTSMAAPHVAGAAAIYAARYGGSPGDVKNALLNAAKQASASEGYTGGSKDDVDEPLLYAGGF
jgi:subtilisin family serine protease